MKVRAEQNDGGGPGGLVGRRVRLDATSDPYTTLEPGQTGHVAFIDDLGTLHIIWDNGSTLGLVPGEDRYTILDHTSD